MVESEIPKYCDSCVTRKLDGCTMDSVRLGNCLRILNDQKAAEMLKFNKKHGSG